jgi:alpha-glucosidase
MVENNFLEPGVTYRATLYKDAPNAHWMENPAAYVIESQEVTADSKFGIKLAQGGGVAISFIPLK